MRSGIDRDGIRGAVLGLAVSALARLAAGREAGACWTTLAIALHALLVIDDFERGVGWAIAQGGDADTNAAVTGALLGYRHGATAIPAAG